MLVAIGDLIEDVVVRAAGPIRHATDTEAVVARRQGGSAANVCAVAAGLGHPARLLARVGDDTTGRGLVVGLTAAGVDTAAVQFEGVTGTIIVLVDADGERTMLTDRRAAVALTGPGDGWLGGADVLHVPLYSLATGALADTTARLVAAATRRGVPISVDVSSVALIDQLGGAAVVGGLLADIAPAVVFANADEADALAIRGPVAAGGLTVVKRGADPAVLYRRSAPDVFIDPVPLGPVGDTTGAGDAFAAGFLTAPGWRDHPGAAVAAGHRVAADVLRGRCV